MYTPSQKKRRLAHFRAWYRKQPKSWHKKRAAQKRTKSYRAKARKTYKKWRDRLGTEYYAKRRAADKCRYARDRAKILARNKRYQQRNPDKVAAWQRAARPRRRGKLNALAANYRSAKLRLTCACCTAADFSALYVTAKRYGKHVDHVLALRLGGRHCIKNLQLLTPTAHRKKTVRDMVLIRRK